MYRNIIVGVDAHGQDLSAVRLATRLAGPDAVLTLVHGSVRGLMPGGDESLERRLDRGASLYDEFASELAICPVGTTVVRERAANVGAALDRAAANLEADLLVVGASHMGAARLLGADPVKQVLRRSACSLAVATRATVDRPISRVGVACDERAPSLPALAHGALLARELGAELLPFSVIAPIAYARGADMGFGQFEYDQAIADTRARLKGIAGPQIEVVDGATRPELQAFSRRVDLLVCGSRRHSGHRRLPHGSTSVWLSRHARCPLLIAPPQDPSTMQPWQETQGTAA